MKRLAFAVAFSVCAGSAAFAADLPVAPPPRAPATYVPVSVPYFNWTGIYIGINGGYDYGVSNWTNPSFPATGNFNPAGFLIGGTVGGNYQMGSFVVGVEGDGDWTNLNATTSNFCGVGCETKSDWLATVRGRAGYAWDRVLFYGTGGVAFANVQASAGVLPFSSSTQVGWTAGAGIEYAFSPNWTAKVEYLFVDLGNATCPVGSCSLGGNSTTVSLNENVIRGGINFKFW